MGSYIATAMNNDGKVERQESVDCASYCHRPHVPAYHRFCPRGITATATMMTMIAIAMMMMMIISIIIIMAMMRRHSNSDERDSRGANMCRLPSSPHPPGSSGRIDTVALHPPCAFFATSTSSSQSKATPPPPWYVESTSPAVIVIGRFCGGVIGHHCAARVQRGHSPLHLLAPLANFAAIRGVVPVDASGSAIILSGLAVGVGGGVCIDLPRGPDARRNQIYLATLSSLAAVACNVVAPHLI